MWVPNRLMTTMMMMMVWCFMSLSTLFKSYKDDRRADNERLCAMCNEVTYSRKLNSDSKKDSNPGPSDPKLGVLTTRPPRGFRYLAKALLMSTNNKCFYGEIRKLIPDYHQIPLLHRSSGIFFYFRYKNTLHIYLFTLKLVSHGFHSLTSLHTSKIPPNITHTLFISTQDICARNILFFTENCTFH